MKKLFLFGILAVGAMNANAAKAEAQYVITDCGTVHPINANATVDEAIAELEYWTSVDC